MKIIRYRNQDNRDWGRLDMKNYFSDSFGLFCLVLDAVWPNG